MKIRENQANCRRRGASAVEFALVFPVFMFLLFALIDLSMYYYYEESMTHVTRSTLRYAVTGRTSGTANATNQLQSALKIAYDAVPPLVKFRNTAYGSSNTGNYSSDLISFVSQASGSTAYVTNDPNLGGPGARVQCIFKQNVEFITPLPRMLNPNTVTTNQITISTIFKTERYQ